MEPSYLDETLNESERVAPHYRRPLKFWRPMEQLNPEKRSREFIFRSADAGALRIVASRATPLKRVRLGTAASRICVTLASELIDLPHEMPKDFWTKTNDAAKVAVREAKTATEPMLKKDWRLKQASRNGSQSRVTLGEIRKLGQAASPSSLALAEEIEAEEKLLAKAAKSWSAALFFEIHTAG